LILDFRFMAQSKIQRWGSGECRPLKARRPSRFRDGLLANFASLPFLLLWSDTPTDQMCYST
jgi:hypothetical protein